MHCAAVRMVRRTGAGITGVGNQTSLSAPVGVSVECTGGRFPHLSSFSTFPDTAGNSGGGCGKKQRIHQSFSCLLFLLWHSSCGRPVKPLRELMRKKAPDASDGLQAIVVFEDPYGAVLLLCDQDQLFFQIQFTEHAPSAGRTLRRPLMRDPYFTAGPT